MTYVVKQIECINLAVFVTNEISNDNKKTKYIGWATIKRNMLSIYIHHKLPSTA